jgi:LmbE family N-acetylglucosaminyl deacetylase
MRPLTVAPRAGEPLRILAIGAHSDDIEIGCGGTLLRLIDEHPGCEIRWVVLSGNEERATEARASAADLLRGAGRADVITEAFRDGFFPYQGEAIKEVFECLKVGFTPDWIFTHRRDDAHQDHRLVAELTWNTFRNHLVFEYEIPKYDGDLGTPNVFIAVDEAQARRKVDILLRHFATQRTKHWFTDDLFLGLLRLRGMEANAPTAFAEGFYCRKVLI